MRDMKPGQRFVTVNRGMAGYFACVMWMNNRDLPEVFAEPWETGSGRYPIYRDAKKEAQAIAADEGLPFIEGTDEGDLETAGKLGDRFRDMGFETIELGPPAERGENHD